MNSTAYIALGVFGCFIAAWSTMFPRSHRAFIQVSGRSTERSAEEYRRWVVMVGAVLGPSLMLIGIVKRIWFE
jgi:hypothetical protein